MWQYGVSQSQYITLSINFIYHNWSIYLNSKCALNVLSYSLSRIASPKVNIYTINKTLICHGEKSAFPPKTLKYWVGVQRGQSYLMGRRCLFRFGWYHNKNTLWGRCFITSTSFATYLFLLGWLKLNLILLLDQLRPA